MKFSFVKYWTGSEEEIGMSIDGLVRNAFAAALEILGADDNFVWEAQPSPETLAAAWAAFSRSRPADFNTGN